MRASKSKMDFFKKKIIKKKGNCDPYLTISRKQRSVKES
jgi:hypothetical protein